METLESRVFPNLLSFRCGGILSYLLNGHDNISIQHFAASRTHIAPCFHNVKNKMYCLLLLDLIPCQYPVPTRSDVSRFFASFARGQICRLPHTLTFFLPSPVISTTFFSLKELHGGTFLINAAESGIVNVFYFAGVHEWKHCKAVQICQDREQLLSFHFDLASMTMIWISYGTNGKRLRSCTLNISPVDVDTIPVSVEVETCCCVTILNLTPQMLHSLHPVCPGECWLLSLLLPVSGHSQCQVKGCHNGSSGSLSVEDNSIHVLQLTSGRLHRQVISRFPLYFSCIENAFILPTSKSSSRISSALLYVIGPSSSTDSQHIGDHVAPEICVCHIVLTGHKLTCSPMRSLPCPSFAASIQNGQHAHYQLLATDCNKKVLLTCSSSYSLPSSSLASLALAAAAVSPPPLPTGHDVLYFAHTESILRFISMAHPACMRVSGNDIWIPVQLTVPRSMMTKVKRRYLAEETSRVCAAAGNAAVPASSAELIGDDRKAAFYPFLWGSQDDMEYNFEENSEHAMPKTGLCCLSSGYLWELSVAARGVTLSAQSNPQLTVPSATVSTPGIALERDAQVSASDRSKLLIGRRDQWYSDMPSTPENGISTDHLCRVPDSPTSPTKNDQSNRLTAYCTQFGPSDVPVLHSFDIMTRIVAVRVSSISTPPQTTHGDHCIMHQDSSPFHGSRSPDRSIDTVPPGDCLIPAAARDDDGDIGKGGAVGEATLERNDESDVPPSISTIMLHILLSSAHDSQEVVDCIGQQTLGAVSPADIVIAHEFSTLTPLILQSTYFRSMKNLPHLEDYFVVDSCPQELTPATEGDDIALRDINCHAGMLPACRHFDLKDLCASCLNPHYIIPRTVSALHQLDADLDMKSYSHGTVFVFTRVDYLELCITYLCLYHPAHIWTFILCVIRMTAQQPLQSPGNFISLFRDCNCSSGHCRKKECNLRSKLHERGYLHRTSRAISRCVLAMDKVLREMHYSVLEHSHDVRVIENTVLVALSMTRDLGGIVDRLCAWGRIAEAVDIVATLFALYNSQAVRTYLGATVATIDSSSQKLSGGSNDGSFCARSGELTHSPDQSAEYGNCIFPACTSIVTGDDGGEVKPRGKDISASIDESGNDEGTVLQYRDVTVDGNNTVNSDVDIMKIGGEIETGEARECSTGEDDGDNANDKCHYDDDDDDDDDDGEDDTDDWGDTWQDADFEDHPDEAGSDIRSSGGSWKEGNDAEGSDSDEELDGIASLWRDVDGEEVCRCKHFESHRKKVAASPMWHLIAASYRGIFKRCLQSALYSMRIDLACQLISNRPAPYMGGVGFAGGVTDVEVVHFFDEVQKHQLRIRHGEKNGEFVLSTDQLKQCVNSLCYLEYDSSEI